MTKSFESQLRKQLRDNENDLDSRTKARLAAGRCDAIEQTREQREWSLGIAWPALGSLAAIAAVAVVLVQLYRPQATIIDAPDEFYDTLEQLEFYEWLAETEFEEIAT